MASVIKLFISHIFLLKKNKKCFGCPLFFADTFTVEPQLSESCGRHTVCLYKSGVCACVIDLTF